VQGVEAGWVRSKVEKGRVQRGVGGGGARCWGEEHGGCAGGCWGGGGRSADPSGEKVRGPGGEGGADGERAAADAQHIGALEWALRTALTRFFGVVLEVPSVKR